MEEEETAVVQRRWDDERSHPCSCLVARDELDGNKEREGEAREEHEERKWKTGWKRREEGGPAAYP